MSLWITGLTRSGKTTHLVREFREWVREQLGSRAQNSSSGQLATTCLVFAANDDARRSLADQLATAVRGSYPIVCKTPLGFMADEVFLFWPLLFERLNFKAQFPLRLRPETEQELATRLWRSELEGEELQLAGTSEFRFVRQTLDLLQLAGASGTPAEDIPSIIEQGMAGQEWKTALTPNPVEIGDKSWLWKRMGELLMGWRQWCLERGLLSYGLIYELYGRQLLSDRTYQQHLIRRYQAVFADDVDDYPAIARDLFDFLLDRAAMGVFTYNPDGQARLGLGADPNYLAGLQARCEMVEEQGSRGVEEAGEAGGAGKAGEETFNPQPATSNLHPSLPTSTQNLPLPSTLKETVVRLATDPTYIERLPPSIQSIQATSRAALLRETAQAIIQTVQSGKAKPEEIAVIAPGLDEIARYTLIEILTHHHVPVEPLNEQRPLNSSPLVRALLTLLALVYPGLGRLVEKDAVAEMLVVLSLGHEGEEIDPVRAGLLADYCFYPDPEQPRLLSVDSFPRWDRLGHRATTAYQEIVAWLEKMRSHGQKQAVPHVISLLDQAIQQFLWHGNNLSYNQLAALRELMETAQHYWEVERRLQQNEPTPQSPTEAIAQFIRLLRRGTITANASPVRPAGTTSQGAVTLATIFQYRSSRQFHRWHFWLDASSQLWFIGGAATLFGARLFLQEWSGRPLTPEEEIELDQQRLQRILRDLLGRAGEQVYLCHSDLAVNGTEHNGPLLTLVNASVAANLESATE